MGCCSLACSTSCNTIVQKHEVCTSGAALLSIENIQGLWLVDEDCLPVYWIRYRVICYGSNYPREAMAMIQQEALQIRSVPVLGRGFGVKSLLTRILSWKLQ
jgi:hypothetical protein